MGQRSRILVLGLLVLLIAGISALSANAAQTASTPSKPAELTYTITNYKAIPASATYPGGAQIRIETSKNANISAVCKDTPEPKASSHKGPVNETGTPDQEAIAQLFTGPTGNHCSVLKDHLSEPFVVTIGARPSDFVQWFSENMKERSDAGLAAFRAGQYPAPPMMTAYRVGKDLTILDLDAMVVLEIVNGSPPTGK
jgi:hypothetical protein